ncbi:MAG: hypothetical protein IT326_04150 [Anaerolineae bacterium]|nr:hypothetical protein [Anaerolineae bacterium]
MKYEHRFTVRATQAEVAEFHAHASGFRALVPPVSPAVIHSAPDPLIEGSILDFTLWMGPIPLRWQSLIEDVSTEGFTDTIGGKAPFAVWRHRHNFVRLDGHTTEVYDQVEGEVKRHAFWGPVGMLVWLSLPLLFAWRQVQTRRHLEKR